MIRKGEVHGLKELMKKSTEMGMQTFDQALFNLYDAGEITYEDALLHADSPNDLRLMIKLAQENSGVGGLGSMGGFSLEQTEDDKKNSGLVRRR
jgi:twitching motility protein PilU